MKGSKTIKTVAFGLIIGATFTGSQYNESLLTKLESNHDFVNYNELLLSNAIKEESKNISNEEIKEEPINIFANEIDTQDDRILYLSDIPYVTSMSNVGWKTITMDKTTDNTPLELKIEGQTVDFKKGVFAHATSNVVYDLEQYNDKYTYFTTYYGVSAQRGRSGSVKFYIYTSKDGINWDLETEESPEIMDGSTNAKFVKIDIRGKKYLKLHAHQVSDNGQDHSLYADAKFITEDYTDNVTKTVEEYDELLKSYEGKPIEGEYLNLLLQRELVNKTGQFILNRYVKESEEQKKTLEWLMNTPDILNMYIMGGYPDGGYYNSLKQLSRLYHTYKDDFNITELTRTKQITYGELYKKLAISLSLSHSTSVYLWMQPNKPENISDPVERYRIYKFMHKNDMFVVARNEDGSPRLNANGKAVLDNTPVFENLEIEEMRYVVNNIIDDESIIWLNEYTQQYIDANPGREQTYLQPHYYMNYIWPNYAKEEFHNEANKDYYNIKYGVYKNWADKAVLKDDHAQWHAGRGLNDKLPDATKINGIFDHYGVNFQNGLYKLWMNIEAGAVCGGISKIGSNIRGVHGLPSSVISQPGHAALIYYVDDGNGNGYWNMDNGITGWQQSGKTERMHNRMPLGFGSASYVSGYAASYILLSQDLINRFDNFMESKKYVMLADAYKANDKMYENYLREALRIEPRNLEAWEKIVTLYLADSTKTEKDYYDLAHEIAESLKYYPLPMYNLINLLKPRLTSQEYTFKYTLLQTRVLKEGSVANTDNIPDNLNVIQPAATRQVASFLLGQFDTSLASFSFSGEDGGKIVMSNRFDGAGIRFDYSLDGGNTWTEKSFTADEPHKLDISSRINEISAENDIKVHLVGADYSKDNIYTIDITKATLPNNLYRNDLENRLINATNNMEWRIKGTDEWTLVGDNKVRFNEFNTHEDGNYIEVEFRVFANGTCLASDPVTYKFFKDEQPRSRTYIPIEHLSVSEVSSEATANGGHAIHAIDGNFNTMWHSNYAGGDTNKFITIELDEAKYISGLDYVPRQTGSNGRINHGKMFVSMDGKEWTEVSDFNWGNSAETKSINIDESVQAKYVKLQALTNYGDGRNFITALMINLYEDLDGERPRAEVAYSTTATTTGAVTVTVKPNRKVTIQNSEGNDYRINEEGNFEFVVKTNKEFTVTMVDDSGRKGSVNVNIDWIVDYDFSFSGDNAGIINVGEKYLTDAGEIEWKYSIDGGKTWVTIENELSAILDDAEIEKMTETNGLQLGIDFTKFNPDAVDPDDIIIHEDGTKTVSVNIPVVAGRNIPYQTLYANDLENKIIGATNEMEWRFVDFTDDNLNILDDNSYENLDEVEIKPLSKWTMFNDSTPKFTGEKKVQVRYAPHDSTLPGEVKTFKFSVIEQDEKHTYISLDNYKVSDYSSETNRVGNYEVATNAIDGNKYTMWHTNRRESVNGVDKYITIELDKPRHLTKLEAIGKDNYEHGNIKDGSVWVSMDGINWDKVAECHDERFANVSELYSANAINKLDKNTINPTNPLVNVKVFEFEPVYAKYIKLQCDKSHDYVHNDRWGLVNGEDRDYFVNLAMLNIYEDTKQVEEDTIVLIDYNVRGITNQNVTARVYSPNKTIRITNNDYSDTYTFTENGEFEFTYEVLNDKNEVVETDSIKAIVGPTESDQDRPNIDKLAPTAQLIFSNEEKTRDDVTVSIVFDEEVIILSDDIEFETDPQGNKMLLFTKNGTVNIKVEDLAGNITTIPVTVDWIDKEVPSYEIEYSTTKPTNKPVTATLNFNEPVIIECPDFEFIKNNDEGTSYNVIINQNINHTIEFRDNAGNRGSLNIAISCIDKEVPTAEVEFSTKDETVHPVTATISPNKLVTITSKGGNSHTFYENGTWTFTYIDEAGNEGKTVVTVDWIVEKQENKVTLKYSNENKTNQDVIVTLESVRPITIDNNGNSNKYTFTHNGSFTFEYTDEYGDKYTKTAIVDWINKEIPNLNVSYDKTTLTQESVTATLEEKEGITITSEGGNTHVFNDNGEFTFTYVDEYGNIGSTIAKVNWIDKEELNVSIVYDVTSKTAGNVTATLESNKPITITSEGGSTHVFTDNGEFTFTYVDAYGNIGSIIAKVNWIDRTIPFVDIEDIDKTPTNKDVVITLKNKEGITVTSEGGNTHTFHENGTWIFTYKDDYGNIGTTPVTVDWIDKIKPTATVEFSKSTPTNEDVVVTLIPSENVNVTSIGGNTHTFKANGDWVFIYEDDAGNIGTTRVTVDWINKTPPKLDVAYDIQSHTQHPVTATLELTEGITVTSEGGNTHVFNENGTFTFTYVDEYGNIGSTIATVDWIEKVELEVSIEYDNLKPTMGSVKATVKSNRKITITNNNGLDTFTFDKNGSFEFEYVDEYGNTGTITAVVDWIDEVKLVVDINYDKPNKTNQNVTATIKANKDITITSEGGNTHEFTENGEHEFTYIDEYGNPGSIIAKVDWISRKTPILPIEYSKEEETTGIVTAILMVRDGITITNNQGSDKYVFTKNGTFTFTYIDEYGNAGLTVAEVTWIREKTVVTLEYSTTSDTSDAVTVTVKSNNDIEILNNFGNNSYTFTKNGEFIFSYKDIDGTVKYIKANVNWIKEDTNISTDKPNTSTSVVKPNTPSKPNKKSTTTTSTKPIENIKTTTTTQVKNENEKDNLEEDKKTRNIIIGIATTAIAATGLGLFFTKRRKDKEE